MSDGFRFPVDRTAILMFASALGETNPIYYDEEYGKSTSLGTVIAPPTFGTAASHWDPNYALRGVRRIPASSRAERPRQRSGPGSGGQLARVLHGEQRFEYHKVLRPGMVLSVSTQPGRSWEKEGRRGGKLRFSESVAEYRDENGELVLTATSVGIVTEKAVEE